MLLSFDKYSACGNDFILVDNHVSNHSFSQHTIMRLCHRQQGIGADGLILLERSQKADFRMRIFNADGSEAEMCGNGVRCLARFIQSTGVNKDSFCIETMYQMVSIQVKQDLVSVKMPSPTDVESVSLKIGNNEIALHYLDTGVPHAVWFVDDLEDENKFALAPQIRRHPLFPKGANVDLATIRSPADIAVRTYERGVEQETLACGTGAVAVAVAAAQKYQLKSPINIHTRSGEAIQISFKSEPLEIIMSGPARKVFSGIIPL